MNRLCRLSRCAAPLVAASMFGPMAMAEDGTWTNPAGGSWAAASNWAGGVIANDWFHTADFSTLDLGANATISLNGARTISRLVFGETDPNHDWTLATGSGGPLTLAESPEIEVKNRTATVSTVLAGSSGLSKTGAGTLVLGAINTYAGDTYVQEGTLRLAANSGNSGTVRGSVNVYPGASVVASAVNALGYGGNNWVRSITIQEGGSFTTTANGDQGWGLTVTLRGGTLAATGTGTRFTAGGGTAFNAGDSATMSVISAPIQLRENNPGNLVTFGVGEGGAHPDLDFTGSIASTTAGRGIQKGGNGTMRMTGTNSMSGPANVTDGTLVVDGSLTATTIPVSGPATLAGSGALGGPVTVQGTLSPGDRGIGTLRFTGALTLSSGSTTRIELAKAGATLSSDRIQGGTSLALGGTLAVTVTGDALAPGDSFTVLSANAITGSFSSVNLPALPGGLNWDTTRLSSQGSLTVTKATQTITFDPLAEVTLGDPPFPLTATATSGLTVGFASSNPEVATVEGNVTTLVGPGYTVITASQAGDDTFFPAPGVAQTLAVNKPVRESQTIGFEPPFTITLATPPFALTAGSSSGLPVTVTSSDPEVATVDGKLLTVTGAGTATLTARQAGNTDFLPAAEVARVVTVTGTPQTISFAAPARQTLGNRPLALSATASSGLPVSFISSDPLIAAVSGNILTPRAPGSITLTARQAGNGIYDPAPEVSHPLTIEPAGATLGVMPRALTLSLRSGEKRTAPLTLANPGTGALDWEMPVIGSDGYEASLEGALRSLLDRQSTITAALPPIPILFSEGITGTAIVSGTDGSSEPFSNGNRLSTDLGGPIEYSDRTVRTSAAFGTGGRYFTLKLPGLFLLGADSDGAKQFNIDGNNPNGVSSDSLKFRFTRHGREWLALVTRRSSSSVADHLVLIDDPSASQSSEGESRIRFVGKRRFYYAVFVRRGDARPEAEYETFARTLVDSLPAAMPGVAVSPETGTVAPESSDTAELAVDATGRAPGSYRCLLDPRPGDPDPAERRIPVDVTVEAPALAFAADHIHRTTIPGGPAEEYSLATISTAGSPLAWSARLPENPAWVSLLETTGTAPEPVRLRFTPPAGTVGELRTLLEVTVPGAIYHLPVIYTIDTVGIRRVLADFSRPRVYAVNSGAYGGAVIVIDPATAAVQRVIRTGPGAGDLSINRDASRAYVINQGDSTVTGIDLNTLEPVGTIAVPGSPLRSSASYYRQIAAGPGSRIFCTDHIASPNLALVDFESGAVVSSLAAATLPGGIARGGFADLHYEHSEKRLYFSRRSLSGASRRQISVVDAATDILAFTGSFPATANDSYTDATSQLLTDLDGDRFFHSQSTWTRPLGEAPVTLVPNAITSISAYGHLVATWRAVHDGRTGAELATFGSSTSTAFTPDQSALILASGSTPYFRRYELPAAIRPPAIAIRPTPADGAAIEENTPALTWSGLAHVDGYRIYLGTDRNAVAGATPGHPGDRGVVTENAFSLSPPLAPGTYFWRIDAIRGGTVIPGTVTSFGVAPFRVSPPAIAVTAPVGALAQQAALQATDRDGQPVAWTATTSTTWITLPQASGSAGTPVAVRLNPAGLAAGVRQGSVKVTGMGLTLEIPVTLELFTATLTRLKPDPSRGVVYGLQTGVLNGAPGHVVAIDAATGGYLRSFALDHYASDFAVHPLEDRLYVPAAFGSKITVIDLATGSARPALTLAGWTKSGRVYPGRAGRLLLENDSFSPQLRLIDTATGGDLGAVPTGNSHSSEPLAVTSPDGTRVFRSAPGRIQPVDVSTEPAVALASVSVPTDPSSSPETMARSHDGSRTSIGNLVLGPQLETIGYGPAAIDALSSDGRLAVHPGGLFWADTGFPVATFPAGYTTTCLSSDDRHVVAWSEALAKPVSIAVGNPVAPTPLPGATVAAPPGELGWPETAGATSYHLYLGETQAAVNAATTGSSLRITTTGETSFALTRTLAHGYRHFWRVDAVTPSGTVKGTVYWFDLPFPQAFAALQAPAGAVLGGSFATSPTGELASAVNQRVSIYEPDPAGGFRHRETFVAPDIELSNTEFGRSLAFGHGIIATGDTRFSPAGLEDSGAAYAFKQFPTGGWFPDATVQPATPESYLRFGNAVAFSSNLLLVGDGYGGRNQVNSYFQWPDWRAGPALAPNPRVAGDEFGAALALDRTTALVGAPGDGFSVRGSAFVFDFDAASKSWIQRARLLPSDGATGDMAGTSVALSGIHAALGQGDSMPFPDSIRRVRVFRRNTETSWLQSASIADPQPGAGNFDVVTNFGESVLLHGDWLFISAPHAMHGGKPGGVVHVYRWNGTTWNPGAPIVSPTLDPGFGTRMAFQNGILFVAGGTSNEFNFKPSIHSYRIETFGNLPPRFLTDPPVQIVAGKAVNLPVAAADDQGTATLSFGLPQQLPPGLSLSVTGEGTARIHGAVTAAAGSEHWLRLRVIDRLGAETIQTAVVRIVSPDELPVLAPLPATLEVKAGEDLEIRPLVTGTAPFIWRWQKDGSDLAGQDRPVLSIAVADESRAGRYRVIVTNAAGTATSTDVVVTVAAADRFAEDWTTFGSGTDRDGHQAAVLGQHRFAPLWTADIAPGSNLHPATVAGGRVFVTANARVEPNELRALAPDNGSLLWRRAFPMNATTGIPSWWAGKLFVQHADSTAGSRLWSLSDQDGAPGWQQPSYHNLHALTAPAAGDAGIFAGSSHGLQGFDAAGTPRFLIPSTSGQVFVPALSEGRLFTWLNGAFSERDPLDGATLWSLNFTAGQTAPPFQMPVIQGDRACVLDAYAGLLRGIDLRLRRQLWAVAHPAHGLPAIAGDRVFAPAGTGVRELSLEDGSLVAVHATDAAGNRPLAGQPLVLNDHWLVTNADKTWIFHRATGALVQTLPHGGSASYAGNRLFLAGSDGRLRAYLANAAPEFTPDMPEAIAAGDAAGDLSLFLGAFLQEADLDDTPLWTIESMSNTDLFRSIGIDPANGILNVKYNPWTSGESDVVVSVTDTAGNVIRQAIRFTLPALPEPDLQVAATVTLNRQTGLQEQRITVTNAAAREVAGFDLTLTGLPAGVTVNNASASGEGTWTIHHRQPLAAGASVTVLVEYYAPIRGTVIDPEVEIALVEQPETDPAAGEAGLAVDRCQMLADQALLIEFTATPGALYEVQYSNNATDWKVSPVKVRAAGNRVQWIDRGPPRTDSPPSDKTARFYRVREIPPP